MSLVNTCTVVYTSNITCAFTQLVHGHIYIYIIPRKMNVCCYANNMSNSLLSR